MRTSGDAILQHDAVPASAIFWSPEDDEDEVTAIRARALADALAEAGPPAIAALTALDARPVAPKL